MKNNRILKTISCLMILSFASAMVSAQKRAAAAPKAKPIVFAVLNDAKWIEPIALIDKGELVPASDGGDDSKVLLQFTRTYYKPKTVYRLVFGGADAGSVTVKSNDPNAECVRNIAEVSVVPTRAKLGGKVMGLATNAALSKTRKSVRRMPTPAERTEIEALVRAEFVKNKISPDKAKNLKYHNLTALDVDADGRAEMVGTFWVEPAPTTRAMLFFIAEQDAAGKYSFGYTDFGEIKQEDVMSGEISSVDEGVYHELLLDVMEYDGDTTSEIFTYTQSFEGAGFNAYSRRDGKWVKAFEGSNYHCGY